MFDIIGRAIGGIGDAVSKVLGAVDNLSTTDEERRELRNELYRIQNQAELELTRLGTEFAKEQAGIIKAEIASQSWMAVNWRPIGMLSFILVILYASVIGPIFGFPPPDMSQIPDKFWLLVTTGFGGYLGLRTVEKVVPDLAEAYKHRHTAYTEDTSEREGERDERSRRSSGR